MDHSNHALIWLWDKGRTGIILLAIVVGVVLIEPFIVTTTLYH